MCRNHARPQGQSTPTETESFVKCTVCFPKVSVVVHCLRSVWYNDPSLRISPTSFWLISYTSPYVDQGWFWPSSCHLSTHFSTKRMKNLGHEPVADMILGYIFLGMKMVLRLLPASPRLPAGFPIKIMSNPKKVELELTWKERETEREMPILKKSWSLTNEFPS